MSFREIAKRALFKARSAITGEVAVDELMNTGKIKMTKTKQYEADDFGNKLSWSYRFMFDNYARRRKFLQAVSSYPAQEWDDSINWLEDISNLKPDENKDPEICVEAHVLVEADYAQKLRHQFETFVACEMILKG